MQRNAVWASEGRSSFHAYVFLKEVFKHENRSEVVVDRSGIKTLKRLGLKYKIKIQACLVNAVEEFFFGV